MEIFYLVQIFTLLLFQILVNYEIWAIVLVHHMENRKTTIYLDAYKFGWAMTGHKTFF